MTFPITLQVQQLVPAAPQEVFDAWTIPTELAKWWAPPGGRCVGASVDLRLGGLYTITNELPGGIIVTIRGEYLTIEPPALLRFTWTTDKSQPATETVTVTFEADGHDTRVAVAHSRIPSQEVAEGHKGGWDTCLEGIVRFFRPVQSWHLTFAAHAESAATPSRRRLRVRDPRSVPSAPGQWTTGLR